jgi:hypothetical protein
MVVCALLIGFASGADARQTEEGSRSEIGVALVAHTSSDAVPGFSPRIAWNLSHLTSIEAFADIGRAPSTPSRSGPGRLVLFGQLKRTVLRPGAGDLFIVAGMHGSYWRRRSGGSSLISPDGTTIFRRASRSRRDWWSGVSIGGGYAVPISRRLTVRADGQFGSTNDGPLLRASIGAAVPVGWRQPPRRIDSSDRLTNGAALGALVGGLGLGTHGYWAFARSSERGAAPIASIMLGGVGAGLGALAGILVDSFVEGRRVIYATPAETSTSVPGS